MRLTFNEALQRVGKKDAKIMELWRESDPIIYPPCTADETSMLLDDLKNTCTHSVLGSKNPNNSDSEYCVDNTLLTYFGYEPDAQIIAKLAALSVYFPELGCPDYSKYIWVKDKHSTKLGYEKTLFRRMDVAHISIAPQQGKNSVYRIRHNGSKEGVEDGYYKCTKDNIIIISKLYFSDSAGGKLLDIYSGNELTEYNLGNKYPSIDFALHHMFFQNGESINKSEEPSVILGKMPFKLLPHNTIMELMNCIPLPHGLHKQAHLKKDGCIQDWITYYRQGLIKILPNYLINETLYNDTLNWLGEYCENFSIDLTPSYDDFLRG